MKGISVVFGLVLIFGGKAMSFDNIRPGDHNYPVPNSKIRRNIAVSGKIPEAWDVHVWAIYVPKDGGILIPATGGLKCGYVVGVGASLPYSVEYELPLVRKDDGFTTSIPMDRFQEGDCGWHLSTVSYSLKKRVADPLAGGRLALDPADIVSIPPSDLADKRDTVDVWCWDNTKEKKYWFNGLQFQCDFANLKAIPLEKRGDARAVYFHPETRALNVVFHDLDAATAASSH